MKGASPLSWTLLKEVALQSGGAGLRACILSHAILKLCH